MGCVKAPDLQASSLVSFAVHAKHSHNREVYIRYRSVGLRACSQRKDGHCGTLNPTWVQFCRRDMGNCRDPSPFASKHELSMGALAISSLKQSSLSAWKNYTCSISYQRHS